MQVTSLGFQTDLALRALEGAEVTVPAAPAGTRALNVAFDITPRALVTAIVTEERVIT